MGDHTNSKTNQSQSCFFRRTVLCFFAIRLFLLLLCCSCCCCFFCNNNNEKKRNWAPRGYQPASCQNSRQQAKRQCVSGILFTRNGVQKEELLKNSTYYIQTYIYVYMHTYIHSSTCIHAYNIHKYIHTHLHT